MLKLMGSVAAGAILGGAGCKSRLEATGEGLSKPTALKPTTEDSSASNTSVTTVEDPSTPMEPKTGQAYLAVARGINPDVITRAAIAALGGIERFVKPGDMVIVKPNICTNYHSPEYATTTNPSVVATLVALCLGAGAKRVRVMDNPFGGSPDSAYESSGIAQAVGAVGGEMHVMSPMGFLDTAIPEGRDIQSWKVYQDVLEADVLINVPIAKHHSQATLTLGCKNLMGVIVDRNRMHANLHQRIADLTSLVRPTLTVVDAVRILTDHGPTGGSLDDVKTLDTIIASHDIVSADAYAATLFDRSGSNIGYIQKAANLGLGTLDLTSISVEEINF
jgi:uncharacterized protein (DUF362 family)